MKMKWLVMAGLALAPTTVVLTGCGGGSNGGLNGGGGGVQVNQFAGVQGSGPLLRDGVNVGAVNFSVNNNGVVTGSLDTAQAQVRTRRISTRALTTASSNVASNGSFSLVFNGVALNGTVQNITFSGTVARSGSTASISQVQVTSSVGVNNFNLNLSVSIAGSAGGGTASGTFNISGGNATGGTLTSNAGVATATRVNGKVVSLAISFVSASTSGARSVTVFINNFTEITPGTFSIASGDASVTYTEIPVSNPQSGKSFVSDTGSVKVDSLSATQVKVTVTDAKLSAVPGFTGTGTVTISGSGTGTIQ